MADLDELRRIAKSNGYYHNIEPFDAEIARLRALLQEASELLGRAMAYTEGYVGGIDKDESELQDRIRAALA